VASERPEVVLAQYSALAPAVAAAHRRGVPVVGIVHDVYGLAESIRIKGPAVGPVRYLGLERSLRLLRPDAFLVPSRATARNLAPLAGGRPVTVVPAGADHVPPDPGGVEVDPALVAFVGRLVRQKGGADLVAAMRILRGRGSPARAVVVGSGPEAAALRATAAAEGLPVRFEPRLGWEELDRLVRGSAVLVLPSTREGWGLAVTEAAARGVPYVAYDVPAVREQHGELQGGVLVAPGPEALADAVEALLEDPGRARALGRRGREAASERTWAHAAEVVEAALDEARGRAL
jgi:glycosyltransferase involved in cell wall biosynthesis